MSQVALTLPVDFPLVGLGVFSAITVHAWQQHRVTAARKASKVTYPTMYVSEAEAKENFEKMKYNCTQRAHQNTLENVPFILAATLFVGVFAPILSTSLCMTWVLTRIPYTIGYSSGTPKHRYNNGSMLGYIGSGGLWIASLFYTAKAAYALYM